MDGESTADIVLNDQRSRWLNGERLREQLADRAADADLTIELRQLAGETLDELSSA
ncbi:MAG: hypothetical protein JJE35_00450 [Thermoleophilia bacterium]|nr:hypothetical protein [Thermoleophilia bacterium]